MHAADATQAPGSTTLRQHTPHHSRRVRHAQRAALQPGPWEAQRQQAATGHTHPAADSTAPQPGSRPARAAADAVCVATGHEARVRGCLLGALCGDLLGQPWEGTSASQLRQRAPRGAAAAGPAPACAPSADSAQLLAAARALTANPRGALPAAEAVAVAAAAAAASAFDPCQGYRHWELPMYQALAEAAATGDMDEAVATGGRYLLAGFSHGAALRALPLGLAYRGATAPALRAAVGAALQCSHRHPLGVDGGAAAAAAAAWLCTRRAGGGGTPVGAGHPRMLAHPADGGGSGGGGAAAGGGGADGAAGEYGTWQEAGPTQLLDYLIRVVETDDMSKRLRLMRMWLPKLLAANALPPPPPPPGAAAQQPPQPSEGPGAEQGPDPEAAAPERLPEPGGGSSGSRGRSGSSDSSGSSGGAPEQRSGGAGAGPTAPPGSQRLVGRVGSWEGYLRSERFQLYAKVCRMVSDQLQQKATDAVAAALWALVAHWEAPQDAVVAALQQGGYTRTVAALAGGLAGSLHGCAWIPDAWLGPLQGSGQPGGVANVAELAREVATLDYTGRLS